MILDREITNRQVLIVEIILILVFSFFPTFLDLPYRVNIFVTYEGAYRMYLGQVPFRDFGLPVGYGYWIIPWLFFLILGPKMHALVIAQAFINLFSLAAFRGCLTLFRLSPVQRLLSILVFCLSFVLINFWPWYNHTVFVFELIGLYFLLRYILAEKKIYWLIFSAFFIALSFLTKQDTGGFALVFSTLLLVTSAALEKNIKGLLIYLASYAVLMAVMIVPFLQYEFSYWFNAGQPPHFSRINLYDFLTAIFEESLWIKFYIAATLLILFARFKKFRVLLQDTHYIFFSLFTLGFLGQALLIQVTSFSPPTSTFYYHSFAFAFLVYNLGSIIKLEKISYALLALVLVLFWRSENYWKYSMRFLSKFLPSSFSPPPPSVVSRNTWASKNDSISHKPVSWEYSPYKSLHKIKLPKETIEGMEKIHNLPVVKSAKELKCLNMTNLTPLAFELGYTPPRGKRFPLWYHKGVAVFDRDVKMLCEQIESSEYDLILFEVMPDVDNFFSFEVRECAKENYKLVDSFISPTGYLTDYIEVYVRRP